MNHISFFIYFIFIFYFIIIIGIVNILNRNYPFMIEKYKLMKILKIELKD